MFDKITSRISKLCYGLNADYIEPAEITMKVIAGVYPGVTTVELDTLAAETAAAMTTKHPDYAILAARIAVSNLHKETKKLFTGDSSWPFKIASVMETCVLIRALSPPPTHTQL